MNINNARLRDVALLVRDVPSAESKVESVRSDQTLAEAQTIMCANQYSQLAVISETGRTLGAINWRSIAQAKLINDGASLVSEAQFRCGIVNVDDDLLKQIDLIYDDDFVFAKDSEERICGIITTADLTRQFRDLTIKFFQIDDIEKRLRWCIDRAFTPDDLRAATGSKNLESAADMTFGQYEYLLKEPDNWRRMGWKDIDQDQFIKYLDEARQVRNKVMHSGDELSPSEKLKLVRLFNLMRVLDPRA